MGALLSVEGPTIGVGKVPLKTQKDSKLGFTGTIRGDPYGAQIKQNRKQICVQIYPLFLKTVYKRDFGGQEYYPKMDQKE